MKVWKKIKTTKLIFWISYISRRDDDFWINTSNYPILQTEVAHHQNFTQQRSGNTVLIMQL